MYSSKVGTRSNAHYSVDLVEDDLNPKNPIILYNTQPRVRVQSDRPLLPETNHRRRVRWSPAEDQILLSVYKKTRCSVQASAALSNGRTNIDCKDRMRTIKRTHPDPYVLLNDNDL